MKTILTAFLAVAALNGCAASYVKYDVSGADSCAPEVRAETAMGVSVTVNDDDDCQPKEKEPENNE